MIRVYYKIVSVVYFILFVLLVLLAAAGIVFEIIDAPVIESAAGKIGISDPILFYWIAVPIVIALAFVAGFLRRKIKNSIKEKRL